MNALLVLVAIAALAYWINKSDETSEPSIDPYRRDRWLNGEPMDPDKTG